jgi:hypothetical protein
VRDDQLTQLLAEASPISDADVEAFDFERAEVELLNEIIGSPTVVEVPDLDTAREGWLRRHLTRARVVAALAGAAAAVAVTMIGVGSFGGDDSPAFAAEAVRVAEANPRLLVTEPGWTVTRADEFTVDNGEMIFSDGEDELEVFWRPATDYKGYFRDRAYGNPQTEIELLGRTATMFRYAGTQDFTTLLPPQGGTTVEIRGDDLGGEAAYLELVRSLRPTDVETWLAAMPESVVQPIDRSATVDEMLAGIPLPPQFDVDRLRRGETVSDRYQLGAQVTGAVICGWLDQWSAAKAAGNAADVEAAERAMDTARSWPILREMEAEGDFPEIAWDWAEDQRGASGFGPNTSRNYDAALGCNDG